MLIAIAQIDTRAGDFTGTCARIVESAHRAEEAGADLLCVSAVALTGPYAPESRYSECFMHDLASAVLEARDAFAIPCLVPLFVDTRVPDAPSMILMGRRRDEIVVKRPTLGMGADGSVAEPTCIARIAYQGLRFGICYSFEDIARETKESRESNLDAVLFFSSYRYARDNDITAMGASAEFDVVGTWARDLGCAIIGVASIGSYGPEIFAGASFAVTSGGVVCSLGAAFEEDLVFCDSRQWLDLEDIDLVPNGNNNSFEECWDILSLGLTGYVKKHGYTDVALVLDGTLQSSAIATLAVDALGPTHVCALIAPSTSGDVVARLADARALAANLRLDVVEYAGDASSEGLSDLVCLELSRLARERGALPLLPYDKTYLALEYAPANVRLDGLCPFGDVYRSDLKNIVEWRNVRSQVIPVSAVAAFETPKLGDFSTPKTHSVLEEMESALFGHMESSDESTRVWESYESPDIAQAVLDRFEEINDKRLSYPACLAASTRMLAELDQPARGWHDRMRTREEVSGVSEMVVAISQYVSGIAEGIADFFPGTAINIPKIGGFLDSNPNFTMSFIQRMQEGLGHIMSDAMKNVSETMELSAYLREGEEVEIEDPTSEEPDFWDPYSAN
jgi:NAD+ synthase (glutamine-hydrolysing)